MKHVSTLQTLSKLEKINKQQTVWIFVQLMKLELFFFSNILFFFNKISKIFKHVHKTIWNLWKHLKSQQNRFNEMNKMKCDPCNDSNLKLKNELKKTKQVSKQWKIH